MITEFLHEPFTFLVASTMGVRISAYAIDLSQFEVFLEATLADLLCRYSHYRIKSDDFWVLTNQELFETFAVTADGSMRGAINCGVDREYAEYTEDQLRCIPSLRRTAREYLSEGSFCDLSLILRAFANCQEIDFIEQLTQGHKRWWIGSVLQFADASIFPSDYDELVSLFRRILRGTDCGYPIPWDDIGVNNTGLAFAPQENDPSFRFGRWTGTDCANSVRILSSIMSLSPNFKCPPDTIDDDSDDAMWHEWACDQIDAFLRIEELDYKNCNVLTFLDF